MLKFKGPNEKLRIRNRAHSTSTKSEAGLGAMEEWASSADRLYPRNDYIFVKMMTSMETVDNLALSTCLSVVCLVLESIHT